MSKRNDDERPAPATRREFNLQLALAAAAPLAAGTAAAQVVVAPTPGTAAAEALTQVVRARHGKHLTDEQLKEVRASVERGLRSADEMKKVTLANSDEPAFFFRADLP